MASSTIVRAVITPAGKVPLLRTFPLTVESAHQRGLVSLVINDRAFLYAEEHEDGVHLPVEAITSLKFDPALPGVNGCYDLPDSVFRAIKDLHEAFVAHTTDGDQIQAFVCVE